MAIAENINALNTALSNLNSQTETIMATIQQLTDAVALVASDVDALQAQVAASVAASSLDPLLTQIQDLDVKVKAIVVPTNG